ncbi:hypothetical protein L21TH_1565 [Caldisalinibacter kiritimatiensis]|uniref:Uncharacterized protein n=1 Tax=Caldisalinibacter kiritimatiensis TaxID=1304284 RepID=R1AUS9_9FIRM|nr:hypothetical protein L21TH_1565 [Caldisalinibacter kiritimatiensis]
MQFTLLYLFLFIIFSVNIVVTLVLFYLVIKCTAELVLDIRLALYMHKNIYNIQMLRCPVIGTK